jgi:hypothetical protein
VVLSRRERYIGIATCAVLGGVALYKLVVEPLREQCADLDGQLRVQHRLVNRTTALFESSRRANRLWAQMSAAGMKHNQSEAESQLVHNVTDWAQEAGLALPSQNAGRSEKEKDFNRITFRATGTGGMSQMSRFLWRIETAAIPIRITDLTITARKDGTDDLSLVLGIGTIYPAPQMPKPGAASPQANQGDQ